MHTVSRYTFPILLLALCSCAERVPSGVTAKQRFLDHCIWTASTVPDHHDFDNYDMAGAIKACSDAADKLEKKP